jgi:3D-(3,5/4)-trihydroxycyclohexane-1,2-dione acylhydrolase (decyclizing)
MAHAATVPRWQYGAWGEWNVGNWCDAVQRAWIAQDL